MSIFYIQSIVYIWLNDEQFFHFKNFNINRNIRGCVHKSFRTVHEELGISQRHQQDQNAKHLYCPRPVKTNANIYKHEFQQENVMP